MRDRASWLVLAAAFGVPVALIALSACGAWGRFLTGGP